MIINPRLPSMFTELWSDLRRTRLVENAAQDLRYAVRSLRKTPGFTLAAVVSLALGICACTTIFGAVDAVLLRSLPFRDLDRLMTVVAASERCPDCDNATPGHYLALREHTRAFASLAGYASWSGALQGREQAQHVDGVKATPNFFSTLGVSPAIGRTFEADSASPVIAHEVVLSDVLWRTHFGSDSNVVGSTITLSGAPYTVVGVMPAAMSFPNSPGLWLSLTFTPAEANDLNGHWLRVVGRLASGVTTVQAQRELDVTAAALAAAHADQARGWRLVSQPLSDYMLHQMRQFFSLLIVAALLVLLIVCANVANLLLARTSGREREIAVRSALGAGRWRIAQQLLAESVVLAVLGAASGAMLAEWTVPMLKTSVPASMTRFVPGWDALALNGRALAFAIALSLVCALLVGVLPAWRASRTNLTSSLREGGHGATALRGGRVRRMLVAAEFALALVLLASAGLMVQSVRNLLATSTGMRVEHVLTIPLELPEARYAGAVRAGAFYTRLQSVVAALPGVQRVAAITTLPLSHDRNFTHFNVSGKVDLPMAQAPTAVSEFVTPGYFETLGITLVGGRDFTTHDDSGAPPVAIVNEKMAKRYWPGEDAIGHGLELYGTRYQIIGVAADVRDQMESAPPITIYQPELDIGSRNLTLVVRAACAAQERACDAESLAPSIRRAIALVDRQVAVGSVRTMPRVVTEYVSPWRLLMTLLGIFAAVALIIAAVGIYGVMMYAVTQRTHEIGIRMALGADRGQVVLMIVRDAAGLIGWGALFGVIGALAVTRVLPFLLYRVSPADPTVIAGVAILLAVVGLVASWLPARRATGVDPMSALRCD
jgi:putative ABC transport system permease protein